MNWAAWKRNRVLECHKVGVKGKSTILSSVVQGTNSTRKAVQYNTNRCYDRRSEVVDEAARVGQGVAGGVVRGRNVDVGVFVEDGEAEVPRVRVEREAEEDDLDRREQDLEADRPDATRIRRKKNQKKF
jgi:hypothetical protein